MQPPPQKQQASLAVFPNLSFLSPSVKIDYLIVETVI